MEVDIPKCPKCDKNESVVKIVYGKPGPGLLEEVQKGTIVLGGCCPKPEKFRCKECNFSFWMKINLNCDTSIFYTIVIILEFSSEDRHSNKICKSMNFSIWGRVWENIGAIGQTLQIKCHWETNPGQK